MRSKPIADTTLIMRILPGLLELIERADNFEGVEMVIYARLELMKLSQTMALDELSEHQLSHLQADFIETFRYKGWLP